MPEEWAEVRLLWRPVCNLSRSQPWGPGEESPVCRTCSRTLQNWRKTSFLLPLFLFPLLLWCYCHFSCTLSVSHCGLTPSPPPTPPPSPPLSLIISGACEFRQHLVADLLRAERQLLDSEALFSLSRMYWGFPITIKEIWGFPVFMCPFWTLFHPFKVDMEEWTHHRCAAQHLWLTADCQWLRLSKTKKQYFCWNIRPEVAVTPDNHALSICSSILWLASSLPRSSGLAWDADFTPFAFVTEVLT